MARIPGVGSARAGQSRDLTGNGDLYHSELAPYCGLCWGHGDGLLGSVEGTTESIAGPLKGVDVQPHLVDWKN